MLLLGRSVIATRGLDTRLADLVKLERSLCSSRVEKQRQSKGSEGMSIEPCETENHPGGER